MTSIMFRCPTTRQYVQHWIEDDPNAASDAATGRILRCFRWQGKSADLPLWGDYQSAKDSDRQNAGIGTLTFS
jgi:hypothetical protein